MLKPEHKKIIVDKITHPDLVSIYEHKLISGEGFLIKVNDSNPIFSNEYFLELDGLDMSINIRSVYEKVGKTIKSKSIMFVFYTDNEKQSLVMGYDDFLWSNDPPEKALKSFLMDNLSDCFFDGSYINSQMGELEDLGEFLKTCSGCYIEIPVWVNRCTKCGCNEFLY